MKKKIHCFYLSRNFIENSRESKLIFDHSIKIQKLNRVIICKANEMKLCFANYCVTLFNRHPYLKKSNELITKRLVMGFVRLGENCWMFILFWGDSRHSTIRGGKCVSFRSVFFANGSFSLLYSFNIHLVKIIILHWSVHNLKF